MSLILIEGFEHWDDVSGQEDNECGWEVAATNAVETGGRFGGRRLRIYGSHSSHYLATLSLDALGVDVTSFDEFIWGFAVYTESAITTDLGIVRLYSGGDYNGKLIWVTANNRYEFLNENDDVVATSDTGVLRTAGWQYMELKVKVHESAGYVVLRIDGVEVMNQTGINTDYIAAGYVSRLAHSSCTAYRRFDDEYVVKVDATAPNDFLGDCQVVAVMPDGAGNSTDWTPSTGSNYDCVNEALIDDADYVEANTEGDLDLYTMGDVSLEAGQSILAVQPTVRVKKLDAGTRVLKNVVRIGGVDYDVDSKSVLGGSTTPTQLVFPQPTSPASGVAWTESELNGAEIGIEVGGQT